MSRDEFEEQVGDSIRGRFDPPVGALERLEAFALHMPPRPRRRVSGGILFSTIAAAASVAVLAIVAQRGLNPGDIGAGATTDASATAKVSSAPGPTRDSPDLPANLPDLGAALIVIGYSDAYLKQADRTVEAPATLVVLDNGQVVGNVGPDHLTVDYRAFQLSETEFEGLKAALLSADLSSVSLPNAAAAGGGCADCSVEIIRTDISGRTIEVAVWGLVTDLRPGMSPSNPVIPAGVLRTAQLVDGLWEKLRSGETTEWAGELPTLPIAGFPSGG